MSKTKYVCLTKIPPPNKIIQTHGDGTLGSVDVARAAFKKDVQWPNNYIIKIGFLRKPFNYNGESGIDPMFSVEKAIWVKKTIEKYFLKTEMVNLSFKWDVSLIESDIRISFIQEMGAWSTLGREALTVPKDQPTMNLGWTDNLTDADFREAAGTAAVVIHEFGHAIGLIHEHSRADSHLNWNKDAVYKDLGGPPNKWSPETCQEQIFNPVEFDSQNSSVYDPKSIMHYYFPDTYFNDPKPDLPHITELSDLDKATITHRYPGGGGKSIGSINNVVDGASILNWLNNNWYKILLIITVVIIVMVIIKINK